MSQIFTDGKLQQTDQTGFYRTEEEEEEEELGDQRCSLNERTIKFSLRATGIYSGPRATINPVTHMPADTHTD